MDIVFKCYISLHHFQLEILNSATQRLPSWMPVPESPMSPQQPQLLSARENGLALYIYVQMLTKNMFLWRCLAVPGLFHCSEDKEMYLHHTGNGAPSPSTVYQLFSSY